MSMDSSRHKTVAVKDWSRLLKAGLDADTWGQSLEAVDEYEKLVRSLSRGLDDLTLSVDERSVISKVRQAVRFRVKCLTSLNKSGLTLEEMKSLPVVLDVLFTNDNSAFSKFPINLVKYGAINAEDEEKISESEVLGSDKKKPLGGTLLPPLTVTSSGTTTIAIQIEKIGLKDAETYILPRITISVVDETGQLVGPQQDTPTTSRLKPNYVWLENTVHLQTPLEAFKEGWAVFFEFKHYKPRKKKLSTRCFAFMETDEFNQPNVDKLALELYKKPTDFTKRRVHLFTIKPLYLHLSITFNKH